MVKSPCSILRNRDEDKENRGVFIAVKDVGGRGVFALLPPEVLFSILSFLPLKAMSFMTLASKDLRDLILVYVYSKGLKNYSFNFHKHKAGIVK